MLPENFVYLGLIVNSLGGATYLLYTLQGKVKPNRVTWLLWAIIPLIAFFAQINQGVGIQAWLTFAVGFIPLLIFLASFMNKQAEWKIGKIDITCGALSVIGVILWLLTGVGNIAIALSIFADSMAAIPTVIKAYRYPETESHWAFTSGFVAATLTLLTIKNWNFATYGFSLYILMINGLLSILIFTKIGKRFS